MWSMFWSISLACWAVEEGTRLQKINWSTNIKNSVCFFSPNMKLHSKQLPQAQMTRSESKGGKCDPAASITMQGWHPVSTSDFNPKCTTAEAIHSPVFLHISTHISISPRMNLFFLPLNSSSHSGALHPVPFPYCLLWPQWITQLRAHQPYISTNIVSVHPKV